MNALKVGTPASIRAGSSPIGSSCWPLTTAHSPKSIGDSPVRPRPELVQPAQQRARARVADARAGVVEGQDRRRAAACGGLVSCRNRSGCSASGSRRWVCTSMTPGSTSMPPASMTGRRPRPDPVRRARSGRRARPRRRRASRWRSRRCRRGSRGRSRHRQAPSLISISWAPSQSTRRPISAQPVLSPLGMSVAKWLPASGPTRELKLQAPYGKRISHSLISPV